MYLLRQGIILTVVASFQDTIHLPITLAIKNISEISKNIQQHILNNSAVVIYIPADAEADLSFVQLIEAARMDARAAGKSLRLAAPATGSVLKVLQRGGFIDEPSADAAQFWLHQEVRV